MPAIDSHRTAGPALGDSRLWRGCVTATAFFVVALSWSPILPSLLGIPFSVALFAASVLMAVLTLPRATLDPRILLLCGLLLLASMVMWLLSESTVLMLRLATLPVLVFLASQTQELAWLPARLSRLLSAFLMIGVVGAWAGGLYALAGGEPMMTLVNIDGRDNDLYLSTLSNARYLTLIRPSFIYDESGAFSFILCATVALREALGQGRRTSYALLLGGLVTLSLTHLLVTLIYLVLRWGAAKTLVLSLVLAALLAPVVEQSNELLFVAGRFAVEDGRLSGDNRSTQVENFLAVVTPHVFFFGDEQCHVRPSQMCEEHGDISSSPVTPTYQSGIVGLAFQLAVHAGLIAAFFRQKRFRFSALAISLLLLQRPFFAISGYGYVTYLVLLLMLHAPKESMRPGLRRLFLRSAARLLTPRPLAAKLE